MTSAILIRRIFAPTRPLIVRSRRRSHLRPVALLRLPIAARPPAIAVAVVPAPAVTAAIEGARP
jgi:hypothetical protein